MCFDYMNGNICKHLHRIHTMPVDSVEEMELDVPDVDRVSTGMVIQKNQMRLLVIQSTHTVSHVLVQVAPVRNKCIVHVIQSLK